MSPHWYEDRDELWAFARMLITNDEWTARELLDMFAEPWKWTSEYEAWDLAGKPENFDVSVAS